MKCSFPFNCVEKLARTLQETEHYSCSIVSLSLSPLFLSSERTMEGGLPMLNCLLQQTLRSLCSCSSSSDSSNSSSSSKWVYAVFWRILPRNYPPPKWDYGEGALDRSKRNKRNWILVWEDGFCDFYECERGGSGYIKGRFGADVFFKMSHEVYNYGEGLVGKVAAENSHKWVFRDNQNESDPSFISSWNVSIDPQPKAWDFQFNSGIQTIAIISVREGIIQLGSFDKIVEDLNMVISVQRKFSYLQSIPGIFAIQRPYLPIQQQPKLHTQMMENTETGFLTDDKNQVNGVKRLFSDRHEELQLKSINLGWNSPTNSIIKGPPQPQLPPPIWPIPPLSPTMSCSLGALLSKLPSILPPYDNSSTTIEAHHDLISVGNNKLTSHSQKVKVNNGDVGGLSEVQIANIKVESLNSINPNFGLQEDAVRKGESTLNLN